MKILLLFIPLLFLFSCQDREKRLFLEELDALTSKLDSMETVARENGIDTLNVLIEYIKTNTKEVANHYYTDTVDYEIANMMNTYKETRKAFAKNSGNLAKARQAIPEVKESIANLSHDIHHGVGERDKYEEFVAFERGKVTQIKEILTYYMETKDKYTALFIETDQQVLDFIEQLKREN